MLLAANLILRFVLECCGLAAAAYWGFAALDGWPLPNDGGKPVVTVAPRVRLAIEVMFFGLAVILLAAAGRGGLALAFLVVLLIHYAVGYERTLALIAGRLPPAGNQPFGGAP